MTPKKDSNLKALLSPPKAGTLFAPFRSRSANPEGFDSKMKHWICAIQEWSSSQRKLLFCLKDIQNEFVGPDMRLRPDKECIRLVLSEMKRKSLIVPYSCLKSSYVWSSQQSSQLIDSFIDPQSWLSWGMKKLLISPASWALSSVTPSPDIVYSDLTDLSISDEMMFVSVKTLESIAQDLRNELIRVSKAEHRYCFEWPQLIELLDPILNTIVDSIDKKGAIKHLELILEYLAHKKQIAIIQDADVKFIRIATGADNLSDELTITKRDIANARLLRAQDMLTNDADRLHAKAAEARKAAVENYKKQNIVKAKSLLRTHKKLVVSAEQRETQLGNVEDLLDRLKDADSNIEIMQAYKVGAEALKMENTRFEDISLVMDDVYDATAEANHLQQTFNEMVSEVSIVSQPTDLTLADLEAELEDYVNENEIKEKPESDKIILPDIKKQSDATIFKTPNKVSSPGTSDDLVAQLDSMMLAS